MPRCPSYSDTRLIRDSVTLAPSCYHLQTGTQPTPEKLLSFPFLVLKLPRVHGHGVVHTHIHLALDVGSLPSLGLWVEMEVESPFNDLQAGTGGATLKTDPSPAGCQLEKEVPQCASHFRVPVTPAVISVRNWTWEILLPGKRPHICREGGGSPCLNMKTPLSPPRYFLGSACGSLCYFSLWFAKRVPE